MQERLELANVRSLLDELRRQTQRQALRQPEVREIEIRADILARKVTGEKPEQIPLDLELLVQWWQRRLGLRQGCLLRHHIGLRSAAEIEFVLNDNSLIRFRHSLLVAESPLTDPGHTGCDAWVQVTLLGRGVFLRLTQSCLSSREIGIRLQGLIDEPVQLSGVKKTPPLSGNVPAGLQGLWSPADHVGGRSVSGQGLRRVTVDGGSGDRVEIRPYRATRRDRG